MTKMLKLMCGWRSRLQYSVQSRFHTASNNAPELLKSSSHARNSDVSEISQSHSPSWR